MWRMEGVDEFDNDLWDYDQFAVCTGTGLFNPWPAATHHQPYTYGYQEYNKNLQFHNFYSAQTSDSYTSWRRNNQNQLSLPFDHDHDISNLNQVGQSGNNINYSSSAKTRIRWSEDLHDRFVDCVNQLGGPDKATPKAILKLMQQQQQEEELTILHIKSHLQKYRNVKYVPESVEEEEGGSSSNNSTCVAQIHAQTGMQLKEALQLQVDVQKRLHHQLQIQNKLQLRIEEQGNKLKRMIEEQHKNLAKSTSGGDI